MTDSPTDKAMRENPARDDGDRNFRALRPDEIHRLEAGGNGAEDWSRVRVSDRFDPSLVGGCYFSGSVCIGKLEKGRVECEVGYLPYGLYHCRIDDCEVGDRAALHHVRWMSNVTLASDVCMLDVGELTARRDARFGLGVEVEVWNEIGGRAVRIFESMIPADAFLWAKYRGDQALMDAFAKMTEAANSTRLRSRGKVGKGARIFHTRTIRDTIIGEAARIDGADRLENLTIRSDADEPTHIGSGVEVSDGLIGPGCHVQGRVRAGRFILGARAKLESGARFFDSFLGDNSTIACCEVLNALIFPNHEQHHNNSFLIASCLQGQSNIAAGATIGSNHNSRANDGEILAGRGFWPGLCTNFKHDCRFASFSLIAKGNYPAELNIPLPFTLISNDDATNTLLLIPGYWFMYNMYALVRNSWKFAARDKRLHKAQNLDFEYLAPDTVEEIFVGMSELERLVGLAAWREEHGKEAAPDDGALRESGRSLLRENPDRVDRLDLRADAYENSRRGVRVLKAARSWQAYGRMIHYYAVRRLCEFMAESQIDSAESLEAALPETQETNWRVLGGQIMAHSDLEKTLDAIRGGGIGTWDALHQNLDGLHADKNKSWAAHARFALDRLKRDYPEISSRETEWAEDLRAALDTLAKIVADIRASRQKDYANPFRTMSFSNDAEMQAVLGALEENPLIAQADEDLADFQKKAKPYL
ncbi:MAG: DUF4954 family protein [Candidatus Sumerlaeia bacterium]